MSATTPEQLMRSRYSAYVMRDTAYLLRTWAAESRPSELQLDADLVWTGLEILGRRGGTAFHTEGTVEFRASYLLAGRPGELRENSLFGQADGQWVYRRALP